MDLYFNDYPIYFNLLILDGVHLETLDQKVPVDDPEAIYIDLRENGTIVLSLSPISRSKDQDPDLA
ncbi:hypothetical protein SBDP2_1010009 [Syntrophobacter sp. SbD2]|nr:hypothetical protein SBDP2_1010009 [Syntrophobacter sp. SbD2]